MKIPRFLAALLLLASPLSAASWYVSPTGSSSNSGADTDHPWDIITGFNSPLVRPGDHVVLRGNGGRYTRNPAVGPGNLNVAVFPVSLLGAPGNPITVRPYQNERVILDGTQLGQVAQYKTGTYFSGGGYTTFENIEFTNSDPYGRMLVTTAGCSTSGTRGEGIQVNAPGIRIINSIIHDTGQGLAKSSETSPDFELYGSVIFNNGYALDHGGWRPEKCGHGLYIQNKLPTAYVTDNLVFHNFNYQIHQYGGGLSWLRNVTYTGNTTWSGNAVFGGGSPISGLLFDRNMLYGGAIGFGYGTWENVDAVVTNNQFFVNELVAPRTFDSLTITDNVINTFPGYWITDAASTGELHIDRNTYYPRTINGRFAKLVYRTSPGDHMYYWPEWQALGYDVNGTMLPNPGNSYPTSGTQVFVRPNLYDLYRANVTVYNWGKASTVAVDVSGLETLTLGTPFTLIAAQDYFNDRLTGTYDGGGSITIPMTGHTVSVPVGLSLPIAADTFPTFGAFVLTWGCR